MTGNLKANSEPVCTSPSEGAHAPFVRVHPLIFGLETFVSCSFCVNLILPLILLLEKQFLSFCFFLQTHTLKKEEEKSQCLDPSRQTKNSDSLAFCSSPPAPKYCPLLFFFSSSAPSLPIIYSILSDGPAKTLPEDKVSPLRPPHAHVSLPNEISN